MVVVIDKSYKMTLSNKMVYFFVRFYHVITYAFQKNVSHLTIIVRYDKVGRIVLSSLNIHNYSCIKLFSTKNISR